MQMAIRSIQDVNEAIRRRFVVEGANIDLTYDAAKIIESEAWWYIPFVWFGCGGFIVDKKDLYVNWLGSALKLDDCIWGHEHGIICGPVDFAFDDGIDVAVVRRIVGRFKYYSPKRSNPAEVFDIWYTEGEIDDAIRRQYPLFRRHLVWFAIPEIRAAIEAGEISFSAQRNENGA